MFSSTDWPPRIGPLTLGDFQNPTTIASCLVLLSDLINNELVFLHVCWNSNQLMHRFTSKNKNSGFVAMVAAVWRWVCWRWSLDSTKRPTLAMLMTSSCTAHSSHRSFVHMNAACVHLLWMGNRLQAKHETHNYWSPILHILSPFHSCTVTLNIFTVYLEGL